MTGPEGPCPHLQLGQDVMVVEQGAKVHVGHELLQSRLLRRTGMELLLPREAKLLFRPLPTSSWGGILSWATQTDNQSSGLFKIWACFRRDKG